MSGGPGPGRAGYWVGGGLVVVAVVAAASAMVLGLVGIGDRLDGLERVAVPGGGRVELDAGGHTVYFEVDGLAGAETVPVPPLDVTVTGPGGADVPLAPYGGRFRYSFGDRSAVAIATVDVPADGTYDVVVRAHGEPSGLGAGARLAIGRGLGRTVVGGVVLALAVFFGGVGAGVAVIVVTAVRRSRARSAAAPPPPGWPPAGPTGWASGPPGPPAGAPGWGSSPPGPPPGSPGWGSSPPGPPPGSPGWGSSPPGPPAGSAPGPPG